MKILVTGAAGFIGMHTAARLLGDGHEVVGLDNLNDYYDVGLKRARLAALAQKRGFSFHGFGIEETAPLLALFEREQPERVVHLAAQAGVRYSLSHPQAYAASNLQGFLNMLEACRHHGVQHLVYASSSSVYGGNSHLPFAESQSVDHPISLYAATKKANELMAHSYSHLYGLPTTGVRLFTVYGPWGRPDMAPYKFAQAICAGQPIEVYNGGKSLRDFTYIDDAVESIVRLMHKLPEAGGGPGLGSDSAPYRVFNVGNGQPVVLHDFIAALEKSLGRSAQKIMRPAQPGDMSATACDSRQLDAWIGFHPSTALAEGVQRFAHWFLNHHRIT
ncbi:MAG: NAD-dependent epimerase/dehydratase family protein [Comamonadaceae bacterium]|jgi:UDP-glucuronate 4-epimerase|nr:NAD-dependent epimerase/dehydratase family protein [Comamonadaceae bacterium]